MKFITWMDMTAFFLYVIAGAVVSDCQSFCVFSFLVLDLLPVSLYHFFLGPVELFLCCNLSEHISAIDLLSTLNKFILNVSIA